MLLSDCFKISRKLIHEEDTKAISLKWDLKRRSIRLFHQEMKWYEFVSRITASRIALIRKSLYSSRIFEERWTIKWMRFFRDSEVNLRRSPFSSLSLRRAALPSFSSPGKSFSFKIVHYDTIHNQPPQTSSLALTWNKLFASSLEVRTLSSLHGTFYKEYSRRDKNKRRSCLVKHESLLPSSNVAVVQCSRSTSNKSFFSFHKWIITCSLSNIK